MSTRQRNGLILLLVAALLGVALLVIVPGSPLSKKTRLGLDLKGGVELVYQGRPTPQVPKVTPQAIDDAIKTIRKRTDALGVSEPEIQRSGPDQIVVGLPDVNNAKRAEEQVGTTAQLQFYDWEPNVFGNKNQPVISLYQAAVMASKQRPRAEKTDLPPDGPSKQVVQRFHGNQQQIERYYDRQNDTGGSKFYLFGPDRQIIRPGQAGPGGNDATAFYESCNELAQDYQDLTPAQRARAKPPGKPAKGSACSQALTQLAKQGEGPPAGSQVVEVPRGVVILKAENQTSAQGQGSLGYWVVEDDSELSGSDIKDPKQAFDPQTNEPIVTFGFTDKGRKAFARATKREAERGQNIIPPPGTPIENTFQRFAIALDNQIVSLATVSYRDNPEGIDGSTGAQINNIGNIQQTQDLAEQLRIGALPIDLKLIAITR